MAIFHHRCAYFDCQITERSGHLDHLIPISDGGTNHKHNFVLACRHCSNAKIRLKYIGICVNGGRK
ncbi:HNH endonuclease [Moraxella bovoculi]|uniref:HNH endonuclease n=1 Tax=Moraxella bovoculi TaxID=386891 RepID=UPI0009BC1AEF|nr:HNH endonuclease [Moraxella bovoculi]